MCHSRNKSDLASQTRVPRWKTWTWLLESTATPVTWPSFSSSFTSIFGQPSTASIPENVTHATVTRFTVTRELKLFQYFYSLSRRPTEIILFQRVESCLKLFRNYFRGLLQLANIFQHAECRRDNFRTLSAAEIILCRFQTCLNVK